MISTAASGSLGTVDRRVMWASYAYALLVGLALGHFLLGIPIQLTDSFGNMLKLSATWPDLLYGALVHGSTGSQPPPVLCQNTIAGPSGDSHGSTAAVLVLAPLTVGDVNVSP